jgi:hypothetical protein
MKPIAMLEMTATITTSSHICYSPCHCNMMLFFFDVMKHIEMFCASIKYGMDGHEVVYYHKVHHCVICFQQTENTKSLFCHAHLIRPVTSIHSTVPLHLGQ